MSHLIPRKVLFGNPHRAALRISPDGSTLAFLAADSGVMNVWVAAVDDPEKARVVTHDRTTGISQFWWAPTSQHILYVQDCDGDEDFHLYRVDLESDDTLDLTPFDQISAQLNHISHRHPQEILVGINDRDEHWFHDIYRIDIVTGQRHLIEENNQYIGFIADDDLNLRLAIGLNADSSMELFKRSSDGTGQDAWSPWMTIPADEVLTTSPICLDGTGEQLYMLDSRDRDTSAVTSVSLKTGERSQVFATDIADVNSILTHPTRRTIQAVSYTYERTIYEVIDASLADDFNYLASVRDGELEITSQTDNQSHWTVAYVSDDGPIRYYVYDREAGSASFLFSHRPELEDLELAQMHSQVIPARDGLKLVSYLTLPTAVAVGNQPGRPADPLPMVLLVHGGPWWRDQWGFNPLHQLLANRGYAVLSVNFRGSTGFGKSFVNSANMEWAGRMHDDLIDAVQWAVSEGIADRDRVAIMGGSYGGYATLVGLTFTPEVFACGIDIVGPSNLITLMENPPPYWMPIMPMMTTRVGDYTSEEGRQFLESRSPLFHVDRIKRPLLIGQGANDPRVKQTESDQIVAAMKRHEIPVTYVLYPDEGHGFDRPENDISFYAICEAFLAKHLGGRCEDIGQDFDGANFRIIAGRDQIPGLHQAAK